MTNALRTERLYLRCWQGDDAPELLPILSANTEHLSSWIPEHVWKPLPVPELAERLEGFAASFDAQREWRYAIFTLQDDTLLGEVALFPRNDKARVPFVEADRLEIGYWLRSDVTGRGYATEAARAMLDIAQSMPGMKLVEIRCDARNVASAAVPQRLGFQLASSDGDSDPNKMVWYRDIA
jgi:RimJ/RimL family protein N-acetyltransferase